ncbi:PEP-CTERM sorting domain-containing protein [Massilia sp. LXY-6]|uniref:PEP-CTERM sorting domain-containing protein n=1 Tax=Massilia sp. LXY-6 TaxID=3379823 RepID=UPI003EDFF505
MKKLLAFAAAAVMSAGVYAAPATQLPTGPVFIKFNGIEQIAVAPGTTTFAGSNEINWGVILVSTLETGKVDESNNLIGSTGNIFFANGLQGGQVTGMFYDVQRGEPSATNPFPATGGFLDLYWRDLNTMSRTTLDVTSNVRTDFSHASGFTDGTFLGRIMFDTGMDTSSAINSIVGSVVPTTDGSSFTGIANSYGSIDRSAGGLWAAQLDSNYFITKDGQRDLRFKNSYDSNDNWNNGSGIRGANIQDPGQAFALPEPGALSLMGLAMVGMGAALRRREKKAAK